MPAIPKASAVSRAAAETPGAQLAGGVVAPSGHLGLYFEPNVGQTGASAEYVARTGRGDIALSSAGALFTLVDPRAAADGGGFGGTSEIRAPRTERGAAVRMRLSGGSPTARPMGEERLATRVNYFIGNDPSKWRTDVPSYGRVEYRDVYPGVSLAFYGGPSGLEYDFLVSPGADAHAIALEFQGARGVEVSPEGDLVIHAAAGDLVQHAPALYQAANGRREVVAGHFAVDAGLVRFEMGAYDPSRPLVIDPVVLGYSTFLGGSAGEWGAGIAVDAAGSAYITGYTRSPDFPATPGAFDTTYDGGITGFDAFVAKFTPDGTALAYATFLGGKEDDQGGAVAVDAAGAAYVTGHTSSTDFPTTPGAFQTQDAGASEVFVTKLNPAGSGLAYSTFLGGGNHDEGAAIAVDAAGRATVTGSTASTNFPVTPGALQTTFHYHEDAFVTRLSAGGSALVYSTFLGGTGVDGALGIALDAAGGAYVAGYTTSADFPTTPGAFQTGFGGGLYDGFVAKLVPDGSALAYGTFLGGRDWDIAQGVAVDGLGFAYVTGSTRSADFPVTPGAFDVSFNGGAPYPWDAFAVKLDPSGGALAYGTYLGGSGDDEVGAGPSVDGAGNAYLTGFTTSANFPVTPDAFQAAYTGDTSCPYYGTCPQAFVTEVSATGDALVYGTYLGGPSGSKGYAVALDGGSAYVSGTAGRDFPTTPGAFQTVYGGGDAYGGDAFVAKFCTHACRTQAVPKPVP
jgi:hypothetical protein